MVQSSSWRPVEEVVETPEEEVVSTPNVQLKNDTSEETLRDFCRNFTRRGTIRAFKGKKVGQHGHDVFGPEHQRELVTRRIV